MCRADDNPTPGERLGFCQTFKENRKMVGCGCVVVKDDSKDPQAKDIFKESFEFKK